MSYAEVQALQLDRPMQVPEDQKDDEAWREAAGELLHAALREQAHALSADRAGRALEALRRAEASARLFPYSPDVLEGALLLALKYGEAGRALALLRQAEQLGCERIAKTYRPSVEHAAERWNRFLREPEALLEALLEAHHSSEDALTLRELLLLTRRDAGALSPADWEQLRTAGLRDKSPADAPAATGPLAAGTSLPQRPGQCVRPGAARCWRGWLPEWWVCCWDGAPHPSLAATKARR